MKLSLVCFSYVFGFWGVFAQQEPSFTQYNMDASVINPAYALSDGVKSFGLTYRKEVESVYTPNSFMAFAHIPLHDRIEASLRVIRDDIGNGIIRQNFVGASASYIIDIDNLSRLSFGALVGVNNIDSDLSNIVLERGVVIDDRAFDGINGSQWTPQFGAGVFYYRYNFFFGLAVPSIIKSSNVFVDKNTITVFTKSDKYLTAGYIFDVSDDIRIKPNLLLRHNDNMVYTSLLFNAQYYDRLELGYMYKANISHNAMVAVHLNKNIKCNFSYEMYNNAVNPIFKTSFEFGLVFRILPDYYDKIINPRFY